MSLPEEQQSQIVDWMLEGRPYHKIQILVEKEFGIRVSLGAFSAFWQDCCGPALIARRSRAAGLAEEVAEVAARDPSRFDSATIDAIRQKAFELAICPQSEVQDIKSIFMLLQKTRDQDIKAEQLRLARERFEWDAAKAAMAKLEELRSIKGRNDLDEDDKLDKVRAALFGVAPE